MTDAWTPKEREQFTRIRDGFMKTGFPRDAAEAHAARTIEQSRRRAPRPKRDPENLTKDELYREAMRYNITGRSKMDKDELERAVHGYRERHSDDD